MSAYLKAAVAVIVLVIMGEEVFGAEKKDRLQRLNAVVSEFSAKALKDLEGQVVEVLVEGSSKKRDDVLAGYTRKNRLVNFKADPKYIGKLVHVKITEAKSYSLLGEFVEEVKEEVEFVK